MTCLQLSIRKLGEGHCTPVSEGAHMGSDNTKTKAGWQRSLGKICYQGLMPNWMEEEK